MPYLLKSHSFLGLQFYIGSGFDCQIQILLQMVDFTYSCHWVKTVYISLTPELICNLNNGICKEQEKGIRNN